jgi:hypothetical protein
MIFRDSRGNRAHVDHECPAQAASRNSLLEEQLGYHRAIFQHENRSIDLTYGVCR